MAQAERRSGSGASGIAVLGVALLALACRDPWTLERELLAKAEPDECFAGVGLPAPAGPPCPAPAQPKVNGGYVFGLTRTGDTLWLGTSENQLCTVLGEVLETIGQLGLGELDLAIETPDLVCEFGRSHFRQTFVPPAGAGLSQLPPSLGDWRPPHVYTYDTASGALVERTPADERVRSTLGMRSAGSLGDLVILGGPDLVAGFLAEGGAVNLFAFDARSGAYLGSTSLPEFQNIRKWVEWNGALYTGVRTPTGGRVLRWTGTVDDPFRYEEVGEIDAEVVELAVHDGRLFVTTWWNQLGRQVAGLWMSPKPASGGLGPGDRGAWTKVWSAADYEPDEAVAHSYYGGALHSFDGWLYWGTMNFPLTGLGAHVTMRGGGTDDPAALVAALGATARAAAVFRGRGFDGSGPELEVLYGEARLPAYESGAWSLVPTGMGRPRHGHSGFGNPFNAYVWTMAEFRGQLYVGTFDWSFLLGGLARFLATSLGVGESAVLNELPPPAFVGADLWRFQGARSRALPESLGGVGNAYNYGVRTMVAAPDVLYVGTANPINLATDPDDGRPDGGWELLALTEREPAPPRRPPARGGGAWRAR